MILFVGDTGMGPRVLAEVVRVRQTITTAGTETNSLCSVLGKIVQRAPQINSNLEECTLLEFVVEDHPLGILQELFHVRTSFEVKSFTLWHDHPSLRILVIVWSDG